MIRRMATVSRWWKLGYLLAGLLALVIYNEFLLYYLVLLQCRWPSLPAADLDSSYVKPLKAMILADTHLLGAREGHWFDKLRREWQMERSFQTSMLIHSPDIVFVLGDALDEGKWSSDEEFKKDVARFKRMFSPPAHSDMQVVVGNHDIGFHYMITDEKRRRFAAAFSSPSVRQLNVRGNIFVMVNSMALEGDGCNMCTAAERKLAAITRSLRCAQGETPASQCTDVDQFSYSQPILLQHFPMYRLSDSECDGPDQAPPKEKYAPFKPKFDCLSEEASEKLLRWLSPRLIVSGHTHFGCYREHGEERIPEWTVPSFSWRNTNQPSFILARFTPTSMAVSKCYMPRESTLVLTYLLGVGLLLSLFLLPWRALFMSRSLKTS